MNPITRSLAQKAQANASKVAEADAAPVPLVQIASRLMGNVSHDLRTPITVIRGYIKMMIDGRLGSLSDEQKECLGVAMESANRLVGLAGVIGGTAALMEHIQADVFDIHEIWLTASNAVQPQVLDKGITIRGNFAADRPMVCGDRQMLCDVFEKLLERVVELADPKGNVLAHLSKTAAGGVDLKLTWTCEHTPPDSSHVVSQLLPLVFLHGGQLSYKGKGDTGPEFTLMLPGYSI